MPIMLFRGTEDGNPSNWWIPNVPCLEQMLDRRRVRGDLDGLGGAPRGALDPGLHARGPAAAIDRERLLPRKPRLMSVRGGDRGRGRRAAG